MQTVRPSSRNCEITSSISSRTGSRCLRLARPAAAPVRQWQDAGERNQLLLPIAQRVHPDLGEVLQTDELQPPVRDGASLASFSR